MNSKDIKNFVLNEIKQSKLNCEALADKNFKKAFLNTSFKTEFKELKSLELEKLKLEFNNKDTKELDQKISLKQKVVENILKTLKLSFSDFEPKYSCSKCKDTGILNGSYCDCFYRRYNNELIKNLGIKIDKNHTFDKSNFNIFDNPIETKKLYDKISKWCEDIKTSNVKTLVLSGSPGTGKTYLTECICNKLINENVVVNYYTSFSLNDLFLKYHTSFGDSRVGLLDGILNCDVLIIDDFGSEPKIKTTEEYFYALFNERVSKNLTTIVSTNLNPLQIMDRYGERTFSRLNNKKTSVLFKVENKDLRLKKE